MFINVLRVISVPFAYVPCRERTWFFVERLVRARLLGPRFVESYISGGVIGLGSFEGQGCSTQDVCYSQLYLISMSTLYPDLSSVSNHIWTDVTLCVVRSMWTLVIMNSRGVLHSVM